MLQRIREVLTSLRLTIVVLGVLMVLVVACTLAQVSMGTYGAVNAYIRSWFVWWHVPGTHFSMVVFPGGALAGLVLGVNLVAAQLSRLELSWRKSGMWVIHAGLILLVAGEFVTSLVQTESRLAIVEGRRSATSSASGSSSWCSSTAAHPIATRSTRCLRMRCGAGGGWRCRTFRSSSRSSATW